MKGFLHYVLGFSDKISIIWEESNALLKFIRYSDSQMWHERACKQLAALKQAQIPNYVSD